MKVRAKAVTPDNFSTYGSVVSSPSGNPTQKTIDRSIWCGIADYHIDGATEISLCTVYQQPFPVVNAVERHARSPQILIPIDAPFILPIMKEGEGSIEAFQIGVGEIVVLNQGVWHGHCVPAANKESSYFAIFRKNTLHEDVAKRDISPVELLPDLA